MIISESKLRNIIKESIKEKLMLMESHQATVEQIQSAIDIVKEQWTSPDDAWWIKIESRLKDFKNYNKRHGYGYGNPHIKLWSRVNGPDGTHRENHVGYVLVRGATKEDAIKSITNAVVHLNPWAARKAGTKSLYSNGKAEAILKACNMFFARAYMTICNRSLDSTLKRAKADKNSSYNPFKGREFHHRIGQTKHGVDASGTDWDKIHTWGLIDCDIDDPNAQAELEQLLKANGITPFKSYLSHDGKHYILKDCNDKASKLDFRNIIRKYGGMTNNRKGDPPILFKPDANMMMYSNVGK